MEDEIFTTEDSDGELFDFEDDDEIQNIESETDGEADIDETQLPEINTLGDHEMYDEMMIDETEANEQSQVIF